jgi:NAD(P)-dependent dehydrogenase (short-subunit alcohol dehydrogenase family)
VIVVTGGGRGIGRSISLRLAQDGFDVVLSYLSDDDSARATAEEVRALGRRALCVQADTTLEASIQDLYSAAESFGAVAGVVNNAGAASAVGPLDSNDVSAIRRDLDVNLLGVVISCKYGARTLARAGGGAIVNISSAAATLGSPNTYVHYAAAKAGVDALTVGLSKELAPHIRVNAVSPGTVWTEFHRDPARPAKVASSIPLGRAGDPDEIAGAVAWFFSPDASYVTGANIRVAGGL